MEHCLVQRRGQRRGDRRVEHRQAARVDRVEAGIAPVGLVEQLAELAVVILLREHHAIGIALAVGGAARVAGGIAHLQAAVHTDAHRLRPGDSAVDRPGEAGVRAIQRPPFADHQDRLPLLSQAGEVHDEVPHRVQRHLLAAPGGHLLRDRRDRPLTRLRRVAELVARFDRVGVHHLFVPLAPGDPLVEEFVDGAGPAGEGDRARRHLGRHHGNEVVLTDHLLEEARDRAADGPRPIARDMVGIQEQDEEARARVAHHFLRLAHVARLAARFLRPARADEDVLEGANLLRLAVLEHLEVRLLQVLDRAAVGRRVDVHPDEVRLGAEGRLLRLVRRGLLGIGRLLRVRRFLRPGRHRSRGRLWPRSLRRCGEQGAEPGERRREHEPAGGEGEQGTGHRASSG